MLPVVGVVVVVDGARHYWCDKRLMMRRRMSVVKWVAHAVCHDGRVVKAMDLKSIGVSPRRFKSCS